MTQQNEMPANHSITEAHHQNTDEKVAQQQKPQVQVKQQGWFTRWYSQNPIFYSQHAWTNYSLKGLISSAKIFYYERQRDYAKTWPLNISNWQHQNITSVYSLQSRLVWLSMLTVGGAALAGLVMRKARLARLKGAGVCYIGLGQVLAPEMVNPFLASK